MSQVAKQKRREAKMADQPKWANVSLIYFREMQDQLRDRRTLFTIVILPMLLYPILGMVLLQVAQFTRGHRATVCVIGVDQLTGVDAPESVTALMTVDPSIESLQLTNGRELNGYKFSESISPSNATLDVYGCTIKDGTKSDGEAWVREGYFDCVIHINSPIQTSQQSSIDVIYNVASDRSTVARDRMSSILNQWRGSWVRGRLSSSGIDLTTLTPFEIEELDIAPERTREAAFWSKILPFIMLVWAMTGAFYPAIDLVAGEKERGTLETLLCSPALRSEIVWGKLGAVMSFSMSTAVLNACSMLITSSFVFHQIGIGPAGTNAGAPPLVPMLWLLVALIPLSALFSALALAVAAMARSSKEGQYYLMPLMMMTLPLVMLPMLPGTELSFGTSLIPVTGMFLLVRSLVEGHLLEALLYMPVVILVTGLCLTLAMRWAQRQFESEAVLFGDGDSWELSSWVRHLWRDRGLAATPTMAMACGAVVLVGLFFGKLAVKEMPTSFAELAKLVVLPQLGLILAPTLLMATMMTKSLRTSLRLCVPPIRTWPIIVALAISLHPLHVQLATAISKLYPLSTEAIAAMQPLADQIESAPWGSIVLLMALIPAICEELAFRGFIFGGLVRGKSPWRAVLVSAAMFGISHGVLQQSIAASLVGVLFGWIALRTGSVLPTMLIHLSLNGLSVSMHRLAELELPIIKTIICTGDGGAFYHPLWTAAMALVSFAAIVSLYRGTADDGEVVRTDALADRLENCSIGLRTADPSGSV